MALAHVADPDLLIRTGGEQRISNFLLWQAAYSPSCIFTEQALARVRRRGELDSRHRRRTASANAGSARPPEQSVSKHGRTSASA